MEQGSTTMLNFHLYTWVLIHFRIAHQLVNPGMGNSEGSRGKSLELIRFTQT